VIEIIIYQLKTNKRMKTNTLLMKIGRLLFYCLLCAGVISAIVALRNSLAYRDVELLKKDAPSFIRERGFTITSYDGYEGCVIHGGFTWYQARDKEGFLYNMAIGEWDGELMLYNQTCLNAVSAAGK
jgi:hypothetical protein